MRGFRGTAQRRPRSLAIAGTLLIMYGVTLMILGGLFSALLVWPETLQVSTAELRDVLAQVRELDVVLLGGQALIGLILLIGGVGVAQARGWAWLMAIIGLGVHLLILLIDYWRGEPIYWAMLASGVLCFLLNLREIKQALGLIDDPNDNTRLHDTWEEPDGAHEHRSLSRRS